MGAPFADPAALSPGAAELALVDALTAVEEGALRWPPAASAGLATLLAHPSRTVRRRAAGALGAALRAGDVAAPVAEALLGHEDAAARWGAAFALHRAGLAGPRVVDVALETFGDDNGDLRWAASRVIADAAPSIPGLAGRLRRLVAGGSPATRKMALLCLADAGDRDAAFVCGSLTDENEHVRLAAVTVLGRLGGHAAAVREALAAVAASDPEATVRRAASAVLERLQRPRPKECA